MGIKLGLTCIAVHCFPFSVALGRCTKTHPAIVCLLFQNQDSLEAMATLQLVVAGTQPEMFQGTGGLVGLGQFYKHFVKNTRKKVPHGKIWEFLLLDTLKTTF